ncbi:hypothetical protein [Stenotrophomonas sp.]|uniref:hypothetical protein n=1 Tax=Stenotrophomonas sp. TaxID=69392 RepID=UPI0031CF8090
MTTSIQQFMTRPRRMEKMKTHSAGLGRLAVLVLSSACASTGMAKESAALGFAGAWKTDWCDPGDSKEECGSFSLYLVRDGDRLCGRFNGASPGLQRVDDGEPRSVNGIVIDDSAVLTATSGRNDATYLIRVDQVPSGLQWQLINEVGKGGNGDVNALAERGLLRPRQDGIGTTTLDAVRQECAAD